MIWLQSVYVQSDCRRRKVFQRLLQFATEVVQHEDNPLGLRLYVDQYYSSAQECYRTLCFRFAGYVV
ncbi:MAG: GNAT family N-acetyltransferase, partial [Planctomyces sp.]